MASHMKKLERWFTEELALVGDKVKALEDKVEEGRKEAAEQRKRLEEAQTKKTSSSWFSWWKMKKIFTQSDNSNSCIFCFVCLSESDNSKPKYGHSKILELI